MSALATASVVFACVFGGALLGMGIRLSLSPHHVADETKHIVTAGMGLVATMSALVLGLLVASAKGSYDAHRDGLDEIAVNAALLDRVLEQYGPPAQEARELMRHALTVAIARLWPSDASQAPTLSSAETTASARSFYTRILELSPTSEAQQALRAQALQLAISTARSRLLLVVRDDSDAISGVFLVVLSFWLVVLFLSFGVFAPRNAVAVSALFISALSVAGAIFLILELAQPYDGLIQISSAPLRNTLSQLGR